MDKPFFKNNENVKKSIKAQLCPDCDKPISPEDFRDKESRKEYQISGLCQKCQDNFFNSKEPDNEFDG